ncbi:MAG: alkaline phosphatase family protein, partial [Acidobacteriota bacterium]|nr:alkaline phosphatase family protein [Acidobacteriota bacterium]
MLEAVARRLGISKGNRCSHRGAQGTLWVLALLVFGAPSVAEAYVGPGAGIAFVGSFLVILTTIVLSFLSMLAWPFRMLIRAIKYRNVPRSLVKRFIVVGLDGQDPKLTDRFMKEGKLPNFSALAKEGCYHPLRTTFPSISPVAWSSFSTGSHPARHNIYDFLDRDRRTYLPVLSSVKIRPVARRLKIGKYRIPLGKPEVRLLRKSKSFWQILGEHNIWSTVLRVPITFPTDQFKGAQLSAMCVPDLLGTQGTFIFFTTRESNEVIKEGGVRVYLPSDGPNSDHFVTEIPGPDNDLIEGSPPMKIPVVIDIDRVNNCVDVAVDDERYALEPGKLTDWIEIGFRAAPGITIRGICRMLVTEVEEHFGLYISPISFDPEKPVMPVSHPSYYSTYLAKKVGKFSTLGLAEDTWALNEGIIDDGAFLQMTYDIDKEREKMFFAALERLRKGALVCVFDATDRIQHMFWRYLDAGHPAAQKAALANGGAEPEHKDAIEQLYIHNDKLVGRVMEKIGDGDVLMVCSDHGFNSFRRGVNLNSWLHENGYLHLEEGAQGTAEWLRDVDGSRTKAYAIGLTGIFLNIEGGEGEGIVKPGTEAEALKNELVRKISGLVDEETGEISVRELFDTQKLYNGPYLENAPDLLVGYNAGYRSSWDMATGVVAGNIFEDNVKAWSGDHCIDPRIVPGVLFCNHKIDVSDPALIDIAPTVLQQFGLTPPGYMDGKVLFK